MPTLDHKGASLTSVIFDESTEYGTRRTFIPQARLEVQEVKGLRGQTRQIITGTAEAFEPELYHFPQRFIAGVPPQIEDSMVATVGNNVFVGRTMFNPTLRTTGNQSVVLNTEQVVKLSHELLAHSLNTPAVRKLAATDKEPLTIAAGQINSSTEARVYAPADKGAAQRNLNFAIANLAAYNYWVEEGEAKAKAAAEAKAKAEAEAKRKAKQDEHEYAGALSLYNRVNGTSYHGFVTKASESRYRAAWRALNPSAPGSLLVDGSIAANQIKAIDLETATIAAHRINAEALGRALHPSLSAFAPQTTRTVGYSRV